VKINVKRVKKWPFWRIFGEVLGDFKGGKFFASI
jgi:hypothetical protein